MQYNFQLTGTGKIKSIMNLLLDKIRAETFIYQGA